LPIVLKAPLFVSRSDTGAGDSIVSFYTKLSAFLCRAFRSNQSCFVKPNTLKWVQLEQVQSVRLSVFALICKLICLVSIVAFGAQIKAISTNRMPTTGVAYPLFLFFHKLVPFSDIV
jgi:hypothetical protein